MKIKLSGEKLLQIFMWISVCTGGLFFIYLSGIYLDLSRQYAISWGLVGFLVIANKIERFKRPPLRIFFLLIVVFLTLRYLFWRTFQTLIFTGTLDWIAMMALYFAEIYCIVIHFLGIFTNVWPLRNKVAPLPADTNLYPTVDIFVPTYSEPIELVKTTLMACTQLSYPKEKVRIHVLDDGGTVAKRNDPKNGEAAWERYFSFKRMALELGINYITRETNNHAKAGNLNHAMHHTENDLILVLDCDHVPTRDILKDTTGWFLKDKKLFLVQTPHFFINPDPFEKNLAIFGDAPSENDMFYRGIQLGLDFWNASYFCGSAAVLRRKYLEEVGGIAGDTITEDAETTLELHKRGYNSVFIARPMICGLSPESFDDFIVQRSRWAQGMTQILVLKNPIFAKGMTFYQRLCYLSSTVFWFFGLSRFIFYIVPAAFLICNLKVYHASAAQVIAYTLPHIVGSLLATSFLHGKLRWPFFSEIYESVQSIFLIPVVFSVLFKPRDPTFKVTPKGRSMKDDSVTPMIAPFLVMVFIIIACIPMAVIKWFNYPLFRDVIVITFSWTIFNLFIALASLGAFLERKQVRQHHRMWAKGKANVYFPRMNQLIQGEIQDVSYTGIGVELKVPFEVKPEEHVTLNVRDIYGESYKFEAKIARHFKKKGKDTSFCGCNFMDHEKIAMQLVRYVYGDSQRWEDFCEKKTKHVNYLRIILFMTKMGAKGSKDIFVILFGLAFLIIKKTMRPFFRRMRSFWQKGNVPEAEAV
ncbi:MAG: UDP-forming cellulose synthase catalytic subunit [Candidatus Anammoxibacter sp.]